MITTYLIHFDQPIGTGARGQAQHYLGSTVNLKGRLYCHRHGNGSKLMAHICRLGIKWHVVQTWESETRDVETQLKRRKNNRELCPICSPKTR